MNTTARFSTCGSLKTKAPTSRAVSYTHLDVYKRQRELLAVGFDELLVRVNQDFSAAMGVVVRKLVGYHIGTKHRIVSGTDFEYLIPALDAEILASQWMTGYHKMCIRDRQQ